MQGNGTSSLFLWSSIHFSTVTKGVLPQFELYSVSHASRQTLYVTFHSTDSYKPYFSSSLSLLFLPHFSLHSIFQTYVCGCGSPASFSVGAEHKFRLKFNVHFCFRVVVSQKQTEHSSLAKKSGNLTPVTVMWPLMLQTCQNSKSRYRIIKITEN
jgi:hypothetical protein